MRHRWTSPRFPPPPRRWSRRARGSSPPTRAAARSRSASTRSAPSRPRATGATTARCCSPPRASADYISGVILFDETIRQKAADGTPLVKLLEDQGIIPGIKVDMGAKPLAVAEGETVTEGLDGLRERLAEYRELGARFAKWRADVHDRRRRCPTPYCIDVNAHALARYAALCQEAGIVPIVEPEVLMDGDHTIERVVRRSPTAVLDAVFDALFLQRVELEGMLLKPNMVILGLRAARSRRRSRRSPRRRCGASGRRCPPRCPASCSSRAASATSSPPRTSTRSTSSARTRGSSASPTAAPCRRRRSRRGRARPPTSPPAGRVPPPGPLNSAARRGSYTAADGEGRAVDSTS